MKRSFKYQNLRFPTVIIQTNKYLYVYPCSLVAVCIYRLVLIRIDLSETTKKSALEIRDKIQSEKKFNRRQKFFPNNIFYIPQFYLVCNHLINFATRSDHEGASVHYKT